jgi:hypothetical protein
VQPFTGLPELRLDGLADGDARTLLAAGVHAPIDDVVRERVVAEARGNPLALLELPRSAQQAGLAGGFELPDAVSVPRRIEDFYERRSGSLPAPTQLLLLVAAAEPTGEAALLWRAAERLGLSPEAAAPAEAAGLMEIDTRVRFRHPLVRSAVYRAATQPDRRRAHSALASATDPQVDPDRRAWHRAQAVTGPDEAVAEELERSAVRALGRGGLAASGAFLQRAAELSPDPAVRARRALDAAHIKHEAGAPAAALELLTAASDGPLDAWQRGRLQLLRARVEFQLTRADDVARMLLDAAGTLAPLDAALARETYLHAFDATLLIGGSERICSVREVAAAALAAPAPPDQRQRSTSCSTDWRRRTRRVRVGRTRPAPGAGGLPGQEPARPGPDGHRDHDDSWLWLASRTASALYDDELAAVLSDRHVRSLARPARWRLCPPHWSRGPSSCCWPVSSPTPRSSLPRAPPSPERPERVPCASPSSSSLPGAATTPTPARARCHRRAARADGGRRAEPRGSTHSRCSTTRWASTRRRSWPRRGRRRPRSWRPATWLCRSWSRRLSGRDSRTMRPLRSRSSAPGHAPAVPTGASGWRRARAR